MKPVTKVALWILGILGAICFTLAVLAEILKQIAEKH